MKSSTYAGIAKTRAILDESTAEVLPHLPQPACCTYAAAFTATIAGDEL